jgi:hypothetical protein
VKHYTAEGLGQQFRFNAPILFLRTVGVLISARILAYAYCTIPAMEPIAHGLAAFWVLFAILTALSAYSNVQRGQPAIGAGEGKMILILITLLIVLTVGYDLEIQRGLQCVK